jgi:hypothetical protein
MQKSNEVVSTTEKADREKADRLKVIYLRILMN